MTALDDVVAANARYLEHPVPGLAELAGAPGRQLAVLTCMDTRLPLFEALGVELGQVHFMRNAGGLVTDDALRSLAISQRALGTREIAVIQHTRCGMAGFDDTAFRAELTAESGRAPGWDVPGFDDVTASVRSSVAAVRDCGWLPHRDLVAGFVLDVGTGELTRVD